ncbi:hypothetical protein ACET3Z_026925 [Daucus carota]
MEWVLRPKADNEIYAPEECPNYTDPDMFTIKLFYGGGFREHPKRYVGGGFTYVDFCDVDKISILEITAMLRDCGVFGYSELYYKLPRSDFEKGLNDLSSDAKIVEMAEFVGFMPPKLVYIYSVTQNPIVSCTPDGQVTQEFHPSQEFNTESQFEECAIQLYKAADKYFGEGGDNQAQEGADHSGEEGAANSTREGADNNGEEGAANNSREGAANQSRSGIDKNVQEDFDQNEEEATDKAKGCEKQVKIRVKKAKTTTETPRDETPLSEPTNTPTAAETHVSTREAPQQMGEGTKSKQKKARTATIGEGSQGGVFKQKKATTARNTPLGIQPEDFGDARNAPVTSLRKLEAARKARQDNRKKFTEKAAWKI